MRNNIQLSIEETIARIEYEKNLLRAQCALLKTNVKKQVTSPKNYLLALLGGVIIKKFILPRTLTNSLPSLLESFSAKSRLKPFFSFFSNIYRAFLFLPFFKKLFFSSKKQ